MTEPFVPFRGLAAHQVEPLARVMAQVQADGFDPIPLQQKGSEYAAELGEACLDDADEVRLLTEVDAWVRWRRPDGHAAAYVLQLHTQATGSPRHSQASLLFCDAQIACGSDLSLSSAEVAWRSLGAARSGLPAAEARAVEQQVLDRLALHHRYYRQWNRAFDYLAVDPLTTHLAELRTRQRLQASYADAAAAFAPGTTPAEAAEALARAAAAAESAGDTWGWLVARRLHALAHAWQQQYAGAADLLAGCLADARRLGLEAEVGHLLRLRAWNLKRSGHPEDAEPLLREAVAHEQPASLLGWWQVLGLRELGDVFGDRINADQPLDPDTWQSRLGEAAEVYRSGRSLLDVLLADAGPPVDAAVRRQLMRSYTDNALQVTLAANRADLALAELESSGPAELALSLAEVRAASRLPAGQTEDFLRARATYARHASTVPERFEDYLRDLPADYARRRDYLLLRRRLTVLPGLDSERVVDRVLAAGLDRWVLSFFIGPRHTGQALLLEPASGAVAALDLGWRDEVLRAAGTQFRADLAAARTDAGIQAALDRLLTLMAGLLEPVLRLLEDADGTVGLTVVPRLELGLVPFAALPVGDRLLGDVVRDVTCAPSLGLVAALAEAGWPEGDRGVTALTSSATPAFAGTRARVATTREVRAAHDPEPAAAIEALRSHDGADVLLGCHGAFDDDHPLESRLSLGLGAPLTVGDLAAGLALPRSRSVLLGACEGGAVRAHLSSEHLGFAGTLLAGGVRSVTGSLWRVNPLSTAILAGEFLSTLGTGSRPAAALKAAQGVVRGLDLDGLAAWVAAYLPDLAAGFARSLERLEDRPFAHPDHWAGFFVAGVH